MREFLFYFLIDVIIISRIATFIRWILNRIPEARYETDERRKAELCRHAVTDGVCRYECDVCPWHWDEEEADDQ